MPDTSNYCRFCNHWIFDFELRFYYKQKLYTIYRCCMRCFTKNQNKFIYDG